MSKKLRKMYQTIAIVLIFSVLSLTLPGCGGGGGGSTTSPTNPSSTNTPSDPDNPNNPINTPNPSESPNPNNSPTPTNSPNPVETITPIPEPNLPINPEPSPTPTNIDDYVLKQEVQSLQNTGNKFYETYNKYNQFITQDENGYYDISKTKDELITEGFDKDEVDDVFSMVSTANDILLQQNTNTNLQTLNSKSCTYNYKDGWKNLGIMNIGYRSRWWGCQYYFPNSNIDTLSALIGTGGAAILIYMFSEYKELIGTMSGYIGGGTAVTATIYTTATNVSTMNPITILIFVAVAAHSIAIAISLHNYNQKYHQGVVMNSSYFLSIFSPINYWFVTVSDHTNIVDITGTCADIAYAADPNAPNICPVNDPNAPPNSIQPPSYIDGIYPEPEPEPSPPPPEPGVEDTLRVAKTSWSFTEIEGTRYAIQKGVNNQKMYLGKKDKNGNWSNWIELEGLTNDPPSICSYHNKLLVAHRGIDGGIYVGMINIDMTQWKGWHFTGRNSKFAPLIVSDGATAYLVHDGVNNDKIYYNSDISNWFNNASWKETPRTTHVRVGAAVYQGILWIAHLGYNETKIYWGNIVDNDWRYSHRDSNISPTICIFKGKPYIGHQGLEGKNYLGDPDNLVNWPALKEITTYAPFIYPLQDNYLGYAFVNLYSMRFQKFSVPTPRPPAPEDDVEDTLRTSGVTPSFTEILGENLYICLQVGSGRDGLLYLGIRDSAGTWDKWNPAILDAYTDKPSSIVYFDNKIYIAFTDAVNNIWIGTINLDKTGWSGWYNTGRQSTHGVILATDGTYLYMIHKGLNNIIYYNSDKSNWFNNSNWKDSGRSTNQRPAAFVYKGVLYIAHVGENESRIYWGNVKDNIWDYCNRNTISGPAIAVVDNIVWIGHRGLTDNKNYVINTSTKMCYTLKERTQDQPFLGVYNGTLKYGYIYNDSIRLQNIE